VITLEHVTKSYGGRNAVDDLTLEVPDGEVAVLIGPSGCGKTTTLRMVNRLIEPTSGRILIDGTDAISATRSSRSDSSRTSPSPTTSPPSPSCSAGRLTRSLRV